MKSALAIFRPPEVLNFLLSGVNKSAAPTKVIFLVLLACWGNIAANSLLAQSVIKNWDRAFAQSSRNCHTLTDAIRTSDGGYLLAGHYRNCDVVEIVPSDRNAYWIVKITSNGSFQWQRSFGGGSTDELNAVIQTSDGGYLLGGKSLSSISGDRTQGSRGHYDYWIVKVSSTGTKLWDRRYGGRSIDELSSIVPDADGGFLLAGQSLSSAGGDKTQNGFGGWDYWIVKINSTGAKLWDRTLGGNSADFLSSAIKTSDGGYLLGGYSLSGAGGSKSQASQGGYDYWVVKVTSLGIRQWDRRFGGADWDLLSSISQTSDAGYLLGGRSASGASGNKSQSSYGGQDYWVVKISGTGAKVWDRRYGGTGGDVLNSIARTADGGFLLGGVTDSRPGGDITQSSRGSGDFWVIKITGAGAKQWNRRYGGTASDALQRAIALSNPFTGTTGFLLAGTSASGISGDRTQSKKSYSDFWVVRISIQLVIGGAELDPSLTEIENNDAHNDMSFAPDLKANPNPFASNVTLTFTLKQSEQVSLLVYDAKGSVVARLFTGKADAGKSYRFDLASGALPSGMYVAQLITPTKTNSIKLILSK